MIKQTIYALDFDGVICDSAIETGITGWKVAKQIWSDMPDTASLEMISLFRQVRPVMETGYEAILIMRLLFEGVSSDELLNNFTSSIDSIIRKNTLKTDDLKQMFGQTRDRWITSNMTEWIEMNPLFEGVAEKLCSLEVKNCTIITTKQERFVSQILAANNIDFPAKQIYGLDRKMSKQDVLNDLQTHYEGSKLLFVEDRLPTLFNILADPRLKHVISLFADWGYNTQKDKTEAQNTVNIRTITLSDFIVL